MEYRLSRYNFIVGTNKRPLPLLMGSADHRRNVFEAQVMGPSPRFQGDPATLSETYFSHFYLPDLKGKINGIAAPMSLSLAYRAVRDFNRVSGA